MVPTRHKKSSPNAPFQVSHSLVPARPAPVSGVSPLLVVVGPDAAPHPRGSDGPLSPTAPWRQQSAADVRTLSPRSARHPPPARPSDAGASDDASRTCLADAPAAIRV